MNGQMQMEHIHTEFEEPDSMELSLEARITIKNPGVLTQGGDFELVALVGELVIRDRVNTDRVETQPTNDTRPPVEKLEPNANEVELFRTPIPASASGQMVAVNHRKLGQMHGRVAHVCDESVTLQIDNSSYANMVLQDRIGEWWYKSDPSGANLNPG